MPKKDITGREGGGKREAEKERGRKREVNERSLNHTMTRANRKNPPSLEEGKGEGGRGIQARAGTTVRLTNALIDRPQPESPQN